MINSITSWQTMAAHGSPEETMAAHGSPEETMADDGSLWQP